MYKRERRWQRDREHLLCRFARNLYWPEFGACQDSTAVTFVWHLFNRKWTRECAIYSSLHLQAQWKRTCCFAESRLNLPPAFCSDTMVTNYPITYVNTLPYSGTQVILNWKQGYFDLLQKHWDCFGLPAFWACSCLCCRSGASGDSSALCCSSGAPASGILPSAAAWSETGIGTSQ